MHCRTAALCRAAAHAAHGRRQLCCTLLAGQLEKAAEAYIDTSPAESLFYGIDDKAPQLAARARHPPFTLCALQMTDVLISFAKVNGGGGAVRGIK